MARLSNTEDSVLRLRYWGYSQDEIAAQTNLSKGKVNQIISAERELLESGVVEVMEEVGKDLKRSGFSWSDVSQALALVAYQKKNNFDLEEVKDVILKVQKHGIKLGDLPLDIEEKAKAAAELEKRKDTIKNEMTTLESKKEELVKQIDQAENSIAKFRQISDFLKRYNLSPDVPEKMYNAILNAQGLGYDIQRVVNQISTANSLRESVKSLEEENRKLDERHKLYEAEIMKQNIQIQISSSFLKAADELSSMGLSASILQAITETVKKIARETGIASEKDASKKFENDILSKYDAFSGFELNISKMQKEKASLAADIEELKIGYAKDRRTVEALQVLEKGNMKPSDILSIKHLIESEGYDIPTLNNRVTLFGSLERGGQELKKQIDSLTIKMDTLQDTVSLLEGRKVSLEASLIESERIFKIHLQSLMQAGQGVYTELLQASNSISTTKKAVVRDLQEIGEKAKSITDQYARSQRMVQFLPLVQKLNGEPVSLDQMADATISAINILSDSLPLSRSDLKHQLGAIAKYIDDNAGMLSF
jgi:hypothetical protein